MKVTITHHPYRRRIYPDGEQCGVSCGQCGWQEDDHLTTSDDPIMVDGWHLDDRRPTYLKKKAAAMFLSEAKRRGWTLVASGLSSKGQDA